MKTCVTNGYEKRVRWTITVLQQGESGRQCGKIKLGQKAQWHRCWWRRRGQCHSALHRLRSTAQLSVRTLSCFLAHFITLTLAQVESCPHFTSISTPFMVVSLWLDLLHSLLLSLPPASLPLPPASTSATSSSRSSTRRSWKTCATPRQTVRTLTASSTSPHKENKGKSKGTKGAILGSQGSGKGKASKAGLSGLENSKSDASSDIQESALTYTTDVSWMERWMEWRLKFHWTGRMLGTNAWYSRKLIFARVFGRLCHQWSEEVRVGEMNLDTGAAVNTSPLNFGPDGAGDGRFYRTASGEWIPDRGAWQF